MKGKLFIIEGTDGSGKETQTKTLFQRLIKEEKRVKAVSYPNYESKSSVLVKMYLNGEFGKEAEEINPYAASTFYAVDRYASFQKDWKDFYEDGGIIIADRYTTSNMIHQASKIENKKEKEDYLDWLWDLEFHKFKLPVPDEVIFLNMPSSVSKLLRQNRDNKFQGKDIHEQNENYLIHSYRNAMGIAEKYKWKNINCTYNGILKSIEEIHEEVYSVVKSSIENK